MELGRPSTLQLLTDSVRLGGQHDNLVFCKTDTTLVQPHRDVRQLGLLALWRFQWMMHIVDEKHPCYIAPRLTMVALNYVTFITALEFE